MQGKRIIWLVGVLGLGWAFSLAQTKTPTYYQDVKPILEAQCMGCHKTGGIAPFSLQTPQAAQEKAPLIAAVAASGYMPPWMPGPDSPEFLNERKLSQTQKAILAAWAQAGAPLGEAK